MNKTEIMQNLAEEFIEKYELDYGNAYVGIDDNNDLEVSIEAPNHSTRILIFSNEEINNSTEEQLEELFISETISNLYDFDPDEEFEMLWSPQFARHNNFTPSVFIEMLLEDRKFYNALVQKLQARDKKKTRLTSFELDMTIEWLENMQGTGVYEGFSEEDVDFEELPESTLVWYFENWCCEDEAFVEALNKKNATKFEEFENFNSYKINALEILYAFYKADNPYMDEPVYNLVDLFYSKLGYRLDLYSTLESLGIKNSTDLLEAFEWLESDKS